jgi:hypothetical protein
MPWKSFEPRINPRKLRAENSRLTVALARTQEQLQVSERLRKGMAVVLNTRSTRISNLNAKIEQLREQNRQLDQEADRLVEMMKLVPPISPVTANGK